MDENEKALRVGTLSVLKLHLLELVLTWESYSTVAVLETGCHKVHAMGSCTENFWGLHCPCLLPCP